MAKTNSNTTEFVRLGAAWVNRDSSGRVFLSTDLYLAGRKVILFKNRFKDEGSSQPDFQIFLAPLPEDKRPVDEFADAGGLERYDDDLGDIPAGAGDVPANKYGEEPAHLAPEPAQPRRTHLATPQANRAYQSNQRPQREPYQPQRAANVPGGTNAALGGRGEAVRQSAPPQANEEELADPFAE